MNVFLSKRLTIWDAKSITIAIKAQTMEFAY